MSQIVLELSNTADLQLLLSFAQKHNFHVVAVRQTDDEAQPDVADKYAIIRQAANDPLFQADVAEVSTDFEHIDKELRLGYPTPQSPFAIK